MKDSKKRLRATPKLSAEARYIAALEGSVAALEKQNAKLLRMVEMVMEERFFRPVVTGGIRSNVQTSALPLEALSDVATFDEDADAAQSAGQEHLFQELAEIEHEHKDWRARRGLEHVETDAAAVAGD